MSVKGRYQDSGLVFSHWLVRNMIRSDPATNSAFFRLVHKDDSSIQSALKVTTLLQEEGNPRQLSFSQQTAYEDRKKLCKENAMRAILLDRNPQAGNCYDYTFRDWQTPASFGCDILIRTDLNPAAVDVPPVSVPRNDARNDWDTGKKAPISLNFPMILRSAALALACLIVFGACYFLLRQREKDPVMQSPQTQTNAPAVTHTSPPVATAAPSVPSMSTEPTERVLSPNHKYYHCYNPYTEFVLPESDSVYYAPADLKNLTDLQLEVALAEIYARHGAAPADKELADYFSYLSWFTPDSTPYSLSVIERDNVLLLTMQQVKRANMLSHYPNQYLPYYHPTDYYLEASGSRYLTSEDLSELTAVEITLAINEIFARAGFIFEADDLLEYFYSTDWYVPKYPKDRFTYNLFSDIERANIDLLVAYQYLESYSGPSSDNPYLPYLPDSGFILPDSSTRRLQTDELVVLNDTQLFLAEQEIYARHGLFFDEIPLRHYFLECRWYHVEVTPMHDYRIQLTDTERENLNTIRLVRASGSHA